MQSAIAAVFVELSQTAPTLKQVFCGACGWLCATMFALDVIRKVVGAMSGICVFVLLVLLVVGSRLVLDRISKREEKYRPLVKEISDALVEKGRIARLGTPEAELWF